MKTLPTFEMRVYFFTITINGVEFRENFVDAIDAAERRHEVLASAKNPEETGDKVITVGNVHSSLFTVHGNGLKAPELTEIK